MKKTIAVGIILLLVGIMIIVSISTSGAAEEKSKSYVTENGDVSVWIINPVEEKYKAPNVQETWGYVAGAGTMLLGGWLLLSSKQKELLKTDKT